MRLRLISNFFLRKGCEEETGTAKRDEQTPVTEIGFVDSKDCGLVDAVMAGWFQADTGELFRGFPVDESDIVADIGCGAGGATLFCARQGAHVIFTDTDAEKVADLGDKLANTSARKVEGIVSNSSPLPIESGRVTRVISLEVLEHVEEPLDLMKELYRIGTPGARYIISVPDSLSEELQQGIAPPAHFEKPNHINIFSREQFKSLVEEAGLVIDSRNYYGFYWTMWMMLYWASAEAEGKQFSSATHDSISPPYPDILTDWARLWHRVLRMSNGNKIREGFDKLLPKAQIIIAHKPITNE